ncbi:MAG TPA: hypothetical protein VKU35_00385, partial [Candidatus Limnocylindria bacterium]|nr:hypothetical protein [Candidatus Limnocylindria bacterium]
MLMRYIHPSIHTISATMISPTPVAAEGLLMLACPITIAATPAAAIPSGSQILAMVRRRRSYSAVPPASPGRGSGR